jgi:hypothetical protein
MWLVVWDMLAEWQPIQQLRATAGVAVVTRGTSEVWLTPAPTVAGLNVPLGGSSGCQPCRGM